MDEAPEQVELTPYWPSFWATFRAVAVSALIITLALLTVSAVNDCAFRRGDRLSSDDQVAIALAVSALVSVLLLRIGAAFCRLEICAAGIRGRDFLGQCRFVPWASMRSAKCVNLGGWRYVRVFADDGAGPVWIPLFLGKQDAFEASVRSLAPEGNALRTLFEQRDSRKASPIREFLANWWLGIGVGASALVVPTAIYHGIGENLAAPRGPGTWAYVPEPFSLAEMAIIAVAVFVLAYFLEGGVKRRSSHMPFRLGLVALGLGLLGTATLIAEGAGILAARSPSATCNPADFAYCVKLALRSVLLGLVVAFFGGLFTRILRARAERLGRGDHAVDIIEVPQNDRHVFDRVFDPLWLGLLALSTGLFVSIYGLIDFLGDIASIGEPRLRFDFLAYSFAHTKWGTVAALAGGLLTWILHARAKRFKQVVAAQDGTKERPSE